MSFVGCAGCPSQLRPTWRCLWLQTYHFCQSAHLFLAHLIIVCFKEVPRDMWTEQECKLLMQNGHCKHFSTSHVAVMHEFHWALHCIAWPQWPEFCSSLQYCICSHVAFLMSGDLRAEGGRVIRASTLINFMIPPMYGVPSKIGGDLAGRLLLMNLNMTSASRETPVPTAYSRGRGIPLTLASNSPRSITIFTHCERAQGDTALPFRTNENAAYCVDSCILQAFLSPMWMLKQSKNRKR